MVAYQFYYHIMLWEFEQCYNKMVIRSFSYNHRISKSYRFLRRTIIFCLEPTDQPQTIFGSVSADFENHTPGTEDDAAIKCNIASDQVNVIKHLLPARFLQLLTTSAEFTLSGGAGSEPVTPTNVKRACEKQLLVQVTSKPN